MRTAYFTIVQTPIQRPIETELHTIEWVLDDDPQAPDLSTADPVEGD